MPDHKLPFNFRRLPGFEFLRRLRNGVSGLSEYYHDFSRFARFSGALEDRASITTRLARVTKAYHMIEKGLALPEPRPGFGRGYAKEPIGLLLKEVPELESDDLSGVETKGARSSLAEYVAWHDKLGHRVDPKIRDFASLDLPGTCGGTTLIERRVIHSAAMIDFETFARSRHSIRNFTGQAVEENTIRESVALALKSPRVCNRESRRVHAAFSESARAKMLAVQNGNRGFGHLAGAVLMITVDLGNFVDFGERNQGWIDGGIFAMTLAFALHAKGLGTCMLNASNKTWQDRQVRNSLDLAESEVVITFMAVGHIPDHLKVAVSPTPELTQIFKVQN
jgi:nitroreductase